MPASQEEVRNSALGIAPASQPIVAQRRPQVVLIGSPRPNLARGDLFIAYKKRYPEKIVEESQKDVVVKWKEAEVQNLPQGRFEESINSVISSYQQHAVPTRKNVRVISLTGDDWTWLAKIKTVLNNGIGDCSRVFVAVHTASLGDWRLLIKQLSNEPKAEKLRYIFVLDKHAPKFSLDEDFYQQQLHQDLLSKKYEN
uniref:Fatty acid synthase pseudo-KR domain-containing protein n=1 Tax=Timema genevievae TaxID=629358 RepID=A0A7R9K7U5_TIMGE|nr:unnamed protein product [Timema genevievae]